MQNVVFIVCVSVHLFSCTFLSDHMHEVYYNIMMFFSYNIVMSVLCRKMWFWDR